MPYRPFFQLFLPRRLPASRLAPNSRRTTLTLPLRGWNARDTGDTGVPGVGGRSGQTPSSGEYTNVPIRGTGARTPPRWVVVLAPSSGEYTNGLIRGTGARTLPLPPRGWNARDTGDRSGPGVGGCRVQTPSSGGYTNVPFRGTGARTPTRWVVVLAHPGYRRHLTAAVPASRS